MAKIIGNATLYLGDALQGLAQIEDESVQTCITSPPYWGMRDYDHPGQIGLEATLAEYLERLMDVFAQVHRVLRPDGTLWLNVGDAYCTRPNGGVGRNSTINGQHTQAAYRAAQAYRGRKRPDGAIKHKDLIGLPWRLAFALQDSGWYLRQDIIWHKPNPMPESVRDRCTKAHEYLFLLSKSPRYYYDEVAIREPTTGNAHERGNGVNPKAMKTPDGWDTGKGSHGSFHREGREKGQTGYQHRPRVKQNASFSAAISGRTTSGNKARKPASARGVPVDTNGQSNGAVAGSVPWEGDTKNKRSVWTVPAEPCPEAHFATFPTRLIEPCVLAGSAPGDLVLDPFVGTGTTGVVALEHGRRFVGIELSHKYMAMVRRRVTAAQRRARTFA